MEDGVSGKVGLFFGVRERGEKSKTGTNQGLVLQFPLVNELLKLLKVGLAPGDLLFPLSPSQFCEQWWATLRELNMEWAGPPHNLRHSGAACFVEQGSGLEEARRRGRWASPASVQRYTKTHFLVRHRARAPTSVLEEGAKFWKQPVAEFLRLLAESNAIETPIGRRPFEGLANFEDKKARWRRC